MRGTRSTARRGDGSVPAVSQTIRLRLQSDIPTAMKARDPLRVSVLRTAVAAIANAEAVDAAGSRPANGLHANEVARLVVHDHEAEAIVAAIRDELHEAAEEMRALGQHDVAAEKLHQAEILDAYLA